MVITIFIDQLNVISHTNFLREEQKEEGVACGIFGWEKN